jgi:hypothetical protein
MTDTPDKGESLSAIRRAAARARWAKPAVKLPIMPTALMLVVDNAPKPAPAAEKTAPPKKAATVEQRVAEITDDCVTAYNAILAKPHGALAAVRQAGIIERRKAVKRSIEVASRMCNELYGDPKITPDFWRQYFEEVKKDDFRAGRQGGRGPGHENWVPTFDYLVRPATMVDVFEKAMSRAG